MTTQLPTLQSFTRVELCDEILRLKKKKKAVLLAHYYQEPIIQDLADFVGDSLGLSRQAAETSATIIVFAGVRFMGEMAKIINPHKKVLVPDLNASCSLAESCPPKEFKKFIDAHPGHAVVTYINCSADIKAMSDIIFTSANAVKVIDSIPKTQPIICAPDINLGKYLIKKTGRDMVLWDGACMVHESFAIDKILKLHAEHPKAKFIAHPESEPNILKIASFVGSTTALLKHVETDPANEFIVATEVGILHQMQKTAKGKVIIPAPTNEDNTCECGECPYMKMNTLEKLYMSLKNETPEIIIHEDVRIKALIPIQRMFDVSNNY